jgi:uncharacterized repeat protein (TIGR01451 family)
VVPLPEPEAVDEVDPVIVSEPTVEIDAEAEPAVAPAEAEIVSVPVVVTSSLEVLPVTVAAAVPLVVPATGPRSDFPPPVIVGEGCDLTTIATFWAGQNYDAGTVSVHNDSETLFVTFATTGGWTMGLTHLYVGLVPPDSYAPGSFPYQSVHDPAVTSYTYEIPLATIGAVPGDTVYVAAHAEVSNGEQNETAWAGQGQWPGLLFSHVIQECIPDPIPADITVVKFNDLDEDGVFDDDEPLLEGIEIIIDGTEYSDSALTDEFGQVVFGPLYADTYSIDEVLPEGWFATVDLPLEVVLVEGQDQKVYIGNAEEPVLPFTDIDLAIEKQADVETASAGDLITYTLTYRNLGTTSASDFTIADDYNESLVEVVDAAGGTVSGGRITWELAGPLGPEDGPMTIVYVVRVLNPVPAGVTSIDNFVVISHPEDNNLENNDDEDTVAVEPFLPFTPKPTPSNPTTPTSDPYLPYTGSEGWLLAMFAAAAIFAGASLRRLARAR